MNPNRYDTEHFTFSYMGAGDLQIRLKNESSSASTGDNNYWMYYWQSLEYPSHIDIFHIFSAERGKSPDIHIHKAGQFFTPWFKRETDCRSELEWGINRFYALNGYNLLNVGPDQFDLAIKANQTAYNQILEKIPELLESRLDLITRLSANYQDKGVSTARGSTIFDTKDRVWIMYETPIKHSSIPEYLWSVSHFSPAFAPWEGSVAMGRYLGNGDEVKEADTNQKCFEYIMHAQKELYGINATDLDKVENNIARMSAIIKQLELILDIPPAKTAVPDLDA